MEPILSLNQNIEGELAEMESLIEELADREEYSCTGNGCGADACGIK